MNHKPICYDWDGDMLKVLRRLAKISNKPAHATDGQIGRLPKVREGRKGVCWPGGEK